MAPTAMFIWVTAKIECRGSHTSLIAASPWVLCTCRCPVLSINETGQVPYTQQLMQRSCLDASIGPTLCSQQRNAKRPRTPRSIREQATIVKFVRGYLIRSTSHTMACANNKMSTKRSRSSADLGPSNRSSLSLFQPRIVQDL
ncbi:hypothetical protein CGRA01v4_03219 [Colletotrichum graminicola]|nr:hypothetical protein CGRA01v4_03219 [Colletotrichum graminicola]